ncbi:hypothetical protein ES288_A08G278300v1 [Gossypium darwinii]|uniref:Uncharacterized protein n=1 Tax=Gossypium darwinii TaxID=34276 RepID=A0A5D2FRP2_GOSDA|nr:hypothetical protein ES288_A08G278300v1 [Gossypium darwinii]
MENTRTKEWSKRKEGEPETSMNKRCCSPPFENSSVDELAQQIQSKLDSLNNYQHVKPDYCIFRIPGKFSDEYLAPYRPRYTVIGPLVYYYYLSGCHQEEEKQRYLASLNDFIELIEKYLPKIRGCYEKMYYRYWDDSVGRARQDKRAGNQSHSSLLIGMILVDAGFILELLLRAYSEGLRAENDLIFAKSGTIHDLKRDLMLLENQLPFFLLKKMYKRALKCNPHYPSFLHLTCHFFSHYYNQSISIDEVLSPNNPHSSEYRSNLEDPKHFTDLIRTFQQPYSTIHKQQQWKVQQQQQGAYLYSAVLLREAGVKFKVSLNTCLFDIEFDENNGELKIPPLKVDDSTESFYGNLMVWEQCYYPNDTFICHYIFLIGYLIKSAEDVSILVRKRILIKQLGSPIEIVAMFNRLCKYINVGTENRYSSLFMKLNAYNAVPHHSWIAILKLEYFSNPWRGVATIAAIILLVLTMIQTICALFSL